MSNCCFKLSHFFSGLHTDRTLTDLLRYSTLPQLWLTCIVCSDPMPRAEIVTKKVTKMLTVILLQGWHDRFFLMASTMLSTMVRVPTHWTDHTGKHFKSQNAIWNFLFKIPYFFRNLISCSKPEIGFGLLE